MRQRILLFAAVLLIVLTAPVAVAVARGGAASPPAAAPATRITIRAATWNMCGEFDTCPYLEPSQVDDKGIEVKNLINSRNLDVVLLQEACEWHANHVLRTLGTQWKMAFAPARQYDPANGWTGRRMRTCDPERWAPHVQPDATDQALGVAVLVKGEIDESTNYELTSSLKDYSTSSPLLCVRRRSTTADPSDTVRACVTHFTSPGNDMGTNGEQYRRAQAAEVAQIVQSFGAERVIVAGDLNSYPVEGQRVQNGKLQQSTILAPIGAVMRECEEINAGRQDGPPTAEWEGGDGKLDHLFVKSAAGKGTTAGELVQECVTRDFASMPWSDHTQITGVFTL